MLKTRIITALILISLVVFTTFYLEPVWFLFISSLLILVGIWEWFKLFPSRIDGWYIHYLAIFPFVFIYFIGQPISFVLSNYAIPIVYFFEHSVVLYTVIYLLLVFFWLVIAPLMVVNYQKTKFYSSIDKTPVDGSYVFDTGFRSSSLEQNPNVAGSYIVNSSSIIRRIYTELKEVPKNIRWALGELRIGPQGTLRNFFLGNFLLWGMWLNLVILLFNNPYILLLLLLIIWSADTAAYFSGKKYGKHILADNVSPGKTCEGVIGGLITGIFTAFLTLYLFKEFSGAHLFEASPIKIILLSSVTVIYSIVGDLFISTIKRQAEKKDTGILFPGHGGVLDRVDSLMAGSVAFMFFGALLDLFDYMHHGL